MNTTTETTIFSAVNGWAEAASKDMRFKLWSGNGQQRVYVEWLHVRGVKRPRWEGLGWIDANTGETHNNNANIQGMLKERGITFDAIANALK